MNRAGNHIRKHRFPNPAWPEPSGWGKLGGRETPSVAAAAERRSVVRRYASEIAGQLGCVARVIIPGRVLDVCHAAARERALHCAGSRCFALGVFAEPRRDAIGDQAVQLAREAGLEVEFIRRKDFRKEDRVAEVLARRGPQPGLVPVFWAMEPCPGFRPWQDPARGRTGVQMTQGKCLHFCFDFVHERLGRC